MIYDKVAFLIVCLTVMTARKASMSAPNNNNKRQFVRHRNMSVDITRAPGGGGLISTGLSM